MDYQLIPLHLPGRLSYYSYYDYTDSPPIQLPAIYILWVITLISASKMMLKISRDSILLFNENVSGVSLLSIKCIKVLNYCL